ncbi:heme-binding protein [Legionella shakespearei]|uniref:heme-binding protein n=1 Tax=Legionella shakespearei TaxID=45075 RepID=UPI0009DA28E6|nr:heme-binding protein [Legionella shakespearei]
MQITINKKHITYEIASKLIQAAIDHANKINLSISAAVTDPSVNLIAFTRMDNAV